MTWTHRELEARVAAHGRGHRAGSPSGLELKRFRCELDAALHASQVHRVLVLGMTPELRGLVLDSSAVLVSMDVNPEAIRLYVDWVPQNSAETILEENWLSLDRARHGYFGAILGDGILPNLLTKTEQRKLISRMAACLATGGAVIMRHPILPDSEDLRAMYWKDLCRQLRSGNIDPDGYGLTMRLWGFAQELGVLEDGVLDNKAVFERLATLLEQAEISEQEHDYVQRFRYLGHNLFFDLHALEGMTRDAGLTMADHKVSEGFWNSYYRMLTLKCVQ